MAGARFSRNTKPLTGQSTARSGPLRPDAVAVVEAFYCCGDLAFGFTRLQCPDCGHEKLLTFSCKTRDFCPSCRHRLG